MLSGNEKPHGVSCLWCSGRDRGEFICFFAPAKPYLYLAKNPSNSLYAFHYGCAIGPGEESRRGCPLCTCSSIARWNCCSTAYFLALSWGQEATRGLSALVQSKHLFLVLLLPAEAAAALLLSRSRREFRKKNSVLLFFLVPQKYYPLGPRS